MWCTRYFCIDSLSILKMSDTSNTDNVVIGTNRSGSIDKSDNSTNKRPRSEGSPSPSSCPPPKKENFNREEVNDDEKLYPANTMAGVSNEQLLTELKSIKKGQKELCEAVHGQIVAFREEVNNRIETTKCTFDDNMTKMQATIVDFEDRLKKWRCQRSA